MKITFPIPPDDGKRHSLCFSCHQGGVIRFKNAKGLVQFRCPHCGAVNDRFFRFGYGPEDGVWWIDKSKELWNESVGIFVRRPDGKYLFFERVAYPLGYTIPAGHVDHQDASTADAAIRELGEEVGIIAPTVSLVVVTDIIGDKCVGGADRHKWSVFLATVDQVLAVSVDGAEGRHAAWLTLDEALKHKLPFATRYIIERFADRIEATSVT